MQIIGFRFFPTHNSLSPTSLGLAQESQGQFVPSQGGKNYASII